MKRIVITLATAALVTGGGVALGQATAPQDRACTPTEVERQALDLARAQVPTGVTEGPCNSGAATTQTP